MIAQLDRLEQQLRREGHPQEADRVAAIRAEMALLAHPPSWFSRAGSRLRAAARDQWRRFLQELGETRETFALLKKRATGAIPAFSAEERRAVRAQVADILKTVPGSALFVGMFFVPVPGAQALTPALLKKLGLLPTAWRESYVLHALAQVEAELRRDGDDALADTVASIAAAVGREADERDRLRRFVERHDGYRVLFDDDLNGKLDASELAEMQATLSHLREVAAQRAGEPIWYTFVGDDVRGPHRLAELDDPRLRAEALVSYSQSGRWAPLGRVLAYSESSA